MGYESDSTLLHIKFYYIYIINLLKILSSPLKILHNCPVRKRKTKPGLHNLYTGHQTNWKQSILIIKNGIGRSISYLSATSTELD